MGAGRDWNAAGEFEQQARARENALESSQIQFKSS
jgi:hypothetical protein